MLQGRTIVTMEELFGRPARRPRRPSTAAPRRTPMLGLFAFLLSAGAAVICGYAIAGASSGDWSSGTLLAYGAIGTGAVAFLLGAVAALAGRGRSWGAAAMVLAVLGDPLVLLNLLGAFA